MDSVVWSMFFSGVVAFQYHPGVLPKERLPVRDCAAVADLCMVEYRKRFAAVEDVWRG